MVCLFLGRALMASAFCFLCSSTLHAQAAADGKVQSLDRVVVTASGNQQQLADTLPSTSVITRADIERSAAPDALSLLRRLPGVEIAQQGGTGRVAGVFLRGGESRHTLVLVDGVPLNTLNFSIASLEHVLAADVERIEVVRGNVSSLYGSQAMGGVIQIFTRRSRQAFNADARAAYGSRDTRDAAAALSGTVDGFRYAVSASHLKTEGFNVIDQWQRPGTNPDRDGYQNNSASARLSYALEGGHEFGVRAWGTRGKVQYDSEFGPATQPDESMQTLNAVSAYARGHITDRWQSTITLARQRDALRADVTAFPFYVTSTGKHASWVNDVQLNELVGVGGEWVGTLAAETVRQVVDSDTVYVARGRTIKTGRAGIAGQYEGHRAQFNLRYDDFSDFGEAVTYYAGYGYDFNRRWLLSGSLSSAFAAPTFNDLFFPFGSDPNLRPERSRTAEIALRYQAAGWLARLSVFQTRYRDLIGNDSAFNRVNISQATVEGVELSAEGDVLGWRNRLAVTVQNPEDDNTGKTLVRRARAFGNFSLSRAFGPAEFEANWRVTGQRWDKTGTTRRTLGGYGLLDTVGRWRFSRNLALYARFENVFNKRYQNAYGYNAASASWLAGVEGRI